MPWFCLQGTCIFIGDNSRKKIENVINVLLNWTEQRYNILQYNHLENALGIRGRLVFSRISLLRTRQQDVSVACWPTFWIVTTKPLTSALLQISFQIGYICIFRLVTGRRWRVSYFVGPSDRAAAPGFRVAVPKDIAEQKTLLNLATWRRN